MLYLTNVSIPTFGVTIQISLVVYASSMSSRGSTFRYPAEVTAIDEKQRADAVEAGIALFGLENQTCILVFANNRIQLIMFSHVYNLGLAKCKQYR